MKSIYSFIFIVSLVVCSTQCMALEANYDESKIPEYTLPDSLIMADGSKVVSAEQWRAKRRGEILELFKQHVYGAMPPAMSIAQVERGSFIQDALGGKARLLQESFYFKKDRSGPKINVCVFLPPKSKKVKAYPAFLILNFFGNHTIHSDENIREHTGYAWRKYGRAGRDSKWNIEDIVGRGYALVTACYADFDMDNKLEGPKFDDGVHQLYPKYQGRSDNWTSIGAWAWGMSRLLDYLEDLEFVDAQRVVAMGHSRLGKTALWAGATDQRFAAVISNNSGCGGAALARRRIGESVWRINTSFPHWFCGKHKEYNDNESAMPVDQHMLISLIAPRPVYVASAVGDKWADPRGEFLSCVGADSVYRLLGTSGLASRTMPEIERTLTGTINYHVRSGKHDVTKFDWTQYLDFADKHMKIKFADAQDLPVQKGMPDPFLMANGKRVQSLEDWQVQREYIKAMLEHYLYGTMPPLPKKIEVKQTGSKSVYGGKGVEENYTLTIRRNGKSVPCRFLVVRPAVKKRYPTIIKNDRIPVDGQGESNASHENFDPGAEAVARGYLLCRFHRTDLAHDVKRGPRKGGVYELYPEYDFGALAVWGWGHGVVLDALDELSLADMSKVVATGHSRGGKAALCAGIYDERVTVTAPNSSGTGGTGSLRYFEAGQKPQTLGHHIGKNEHWFGPRHFQFAGKEARLPYDSHFALAAVAPRALVNCHGRQDYWANPYGTELTHRAAKMVYEWMGVKNLIGLHWRDGAHAQGPEDWKALMDFSDRQFSGKKTNRKYDKWTYPDAELPFAWQAPGVVVAK